MIVCSSAARSLTSDRKLSQRVPSARGRSLNVSTSTPGSGGTAASNQISPYVTARPRMTIIRRGSRERRELLLDDARESLDLPGVHVLMARQLEDCRAQRLDFRELAARRAERAAQPEQHRLHA